jgi:hypothetical protein
MSEEIIEGPAEDLTPVCNCGKKCPLCNGLKEKKEEKISIARGNFWDLWGQKMFRNLASMKFQWMTILCVIVVYGMFFKTAAGTEIPYISAELGLGFLGGGFITLATSRIIARTKLTEPSNGELDTDK